MIFKSAGLIIRRLSEAADYEGGMFSLLSGLVDYLLQKPEYYILILGLDNAGKTARQQLLALAMGCVTMRLTSVDVAGAIQAA